MLWRITTNGCVTATQRPPSDFLFSSLTEKLLPVSDARVGSGLERSLGLREVRRLFAQVQNSVVG
jgi:hypothetical protein